MNKTTTTPITKRYIKNRNEKHTKSVVEYNNYVTIAKKTFGSNKKKNIKRNVSFFKLLIMLPKKTLTIPRNTN